MKRNLITSVLAVIVFTVLLGLVYPLVITGIAQVAFPNRADGSPIKVDGKVVGSKLLAQAYTKPVLDASGQPKKDADGNAITEPDPQYFQPRPSQTDYNAERDVLLQPRPQPGERALLLPRPAQGLHRPQRPYNPGLTNAKVPADAVTTSGSGVDPHISVDNARIQARRVAAGPQAPARRSVDQLVDDNTDGRFLGLLGEPGVNVTKLNLALDAR